MLTFLGVRLTYVNLFGLGYVNSLRFGYFNRVESISGSGSGFSNPDPDPDTISQLSTLKKKKKLVFLHKNTLYNRVESLSGSGSALSGSGFTNRIQISFFFNVFFLNQLFHITNTA